MKDYKKVMRNGLSFLSGCSDIKINWAEIKVSSYDPSVGLINYFHEHRGTTPSVLTRFLSFVDSDFYSHSIARLQDFEGYFTYYVNFTVSYTDSTGVTNSIFVDRNFSYLPDLEGTSCTMWSEIMLSRILELAQQEHETSVLDVVLDMDFFEPDDLPMPTKDYTDNSDSGNINDKECINNSAKVTIESHKQLSEDELDSLVEMVSNIFSNNASKTEEAFLAEEEVFSQKVSEVNEQAATEVEDVVPDGVEEEYMEEVDVAEEVEIPQPVEEAIITTSAEILQEDGAPEHEENVILIQQDDSDEKDPNCDNNDNDNDATMNPYVKKSRFSKKHLTKDVKDKSSSIQYFINKDQVPDPDLSVSVKKDAERLGNLELSPTISTEAIGQNLAFDYSGLSEDILDEIMQSVKDDLKFNYYELTIAHFFESYVLGFGNDLNKLLQRYSHEEGGKYKRVYMEEIWNYINDAVTPMLSVSQLDEDQERMDEIYNKALSLFLGKGKGANIIPAVVKFMYQYYFKPVFLDDPEFNVDKFPSVVCTFLDNIYESSKGSGNYLVELHGELGKKAHKNTMDYIKSNMSIILESVPFSDKLYEEFETKVNAVIQDYLESYIDKSATHDVVGDLCRTLMFNNKHIKVLGSNDMEEVRDIIEEYIFTLYPTMVSLMETSVPNADFNLFSQYMYYSFCFNDEERAMLKDSLADGDKESIIMGRIRNRIISSILLYCIQANYLKFFTHNYVGDIEDDVKEYYQFIYGFAVFFMNIQPYMKSEDDIDKYYEVAQSRLPGLNKGDVFPASSTEFLIMSSIYNEKKVSIPYLTMFKTAFLAGLEKFMKDSQANASN